MLWWTASVVSRCLHSFARWGSSTGRVRPGPCFALLLCRFAFTHLNTCTDKKVIPHSMQLKLSFTDWQSDFGGFTCYVANEEDEEVRCRCSYHKSSNCWYVILQLLPLFFLGFFPCCSFWLSILKIIPSPSSTGTKKRLNLSNTSTTKAPLILPVNGLAEHCMTSLLCIMNKYIYIYCVVLCMLGPFVILVPKD